MKKPFLIITTIVILLAILLVAAIYLSFWQILPTTQSIKKSLNSSMAKIVRIPENLGSETTYEQTIYNWEMETPQQEVVPVHFAITHSFEKKEKEVIVFLEMSQNADASIFNKILPAIIAEEQSLKAAQDPQNANLAANKESGYRKIALQTNSNKQTTKIIWIYEKEEIEETKSSYEKLSKYPTAVLHILYSVPKFLSSLAGG